MEIDFIVFHEQKKGNIQTSVFARKVKANSAEQALRKTLERTILQEDVEKAKESFYFLKGSVSYTDLNNWTITATELIGG